MTCSFFLFSFFRFFSLFFSFFRVFTSWSFTADSAGFSPCCFAVLSSGFVGLRSSCGTCVVFVTTMQCGSSISVPCRYIMANNNYTEQFPADLHRDGSRTPRRQLFGSAMGSSSPCSTTTSTTYPTILSTDTTWPTLSRVFSTSPFLLHPTTSSPTPMTSNVHSTPSPTLPTSLRTSTPKLTHARPFDLRPDPDWKPNEEFCDQTKVGGLELARTIRPSQFSSSYNIEGCDPLLVPLCSLLYAGVNNHALRRLAAGREIYIVTTTDIAGCVLFTHLHRELKQRNIDTDRAAQAFCRSKGEVLDRSDACKKAAQELACVIQQWVCVGTPDVTAQQTISDLQAR